jgi:hypothetical protein
MQGLINITERERQLLLMLIKIDEAWKPTFDTEYKDVLSTDNRKILIKEANINKANLTMYTKSLQNKGCLITNEHGGIEVNPILMPEVVGDIVEYSFTLDLKG